MSLKRCTMGKLINLTGKTFGRLTVICQEINSRYINGEAVWKCICSCIKKTIIYPCGSQLRQGKKKSCGCIWKPEKEEFIYKIQKRLIEKSKLNVETQCIEWTGFKDKNGYGELCIIKNGIERFWKAHRASWLVHNGDIPNNMLVCHYCDNPSCIRIEHLFLGTHKDNMKDKMQKGRHRTHKGSECKRSKLNEIQAMEILNLKNSGISSHELCKKYNIKASTIRSIWQRRTWKHI